MKFIASIIAIIAIIGITGAGTVTLTGSCSQSIINSTHNYTTFFLSNSGNQTASNLTIIPRIYGASAHEPEALMPYLSPGQNQPENFYLYNFSLPGSYSDAFVVGYLQGGSTFYALFPCILNIENETHSLVGISDVNQTNNVLKFIVFNLGQSAVNVSVSTLLPPTFSSIPESTNITIDPNSKENVTFALSYPGMSGASYSVGLSASYIKNGLHYSVLYPFVIGFYNTKKTLGSSAILVAAAFVIFIIIILIIISIVKNRRKGMKDESEAVQK